MIAFYSEDLYIDLSSYGIEFIEENNLFNNELFKNYSLPFKLPTSDLKKIGYINTNHVTIPKLYKGKLLLDTEYEEATMELIDIGELFCSATIFYGQDSLSVFETALNDLPIAPIEVENIFSHASNIVKKPNHYYNFLAVHAPLLFENPEETTQMMNFMDESGKIVDVHIIPGNPNRVDPEPKYLKNHVLPFIKVAHLVRIGFELEGYSVHGEWFEHPLVKRLYLSPTRNLENSNTIDFSKLLPNCTFGKLVEVIDNMFNLNIYPVGDTIRIDFLQNNMEKSNALELPLNLPFPIKKNVANKSFQLSYGSLAESLEERGYFFPKLHIQQSGYSDTFNTSSHIDTTNEIVIDALPMPVLSKNGVASAYIDSSLEESGIYFALWDGSNSTNRTVSQINGVSLSPSSIYHNWWSKWLDYRLNSIDYKVSTLLPWLHTKQMPLSQLYFIPQYHSYFFIKTKRIKRISDKVDEVELEMEQLR